MGVLDTIAKVGRALINPAAAVAGVVGDFVSQHSANKNVDKQIAAQREENEKARSHNLMLAELQNKWNVEQWAKENEYNSPSAQMARYAAAGLNPNLIYGQSNTSAQLSGSLSSGAPASPADMSAYGRKGSPVGKALENLDPFMYEQLRGLKLDNDAKEEGLNRQKSDNSFTEFLRSYNPDGDVLTPQWTKYVNSIQGRRALHELDTLWYNVQKNSAEYSYISEEANIRRIDSLIKNELYQQILGFAKDMQVSSTDAETFVRSMLYAARGIKADALFKEGEAIWNDPSFLEKLPAGLPKLAMFLRSLMK